MVLSLQAGPSIPQSTGNALAEIRGLNFSLLLVAVALFGVALLLMFEGAVFQRWATAREEEPPDPNSGLAAALTVSLGVLLLWLVRRQIFSLTSLEAGSSIAELILNPTQDLVIALLVASIPPGVLALVKFSLAISLGSKRPPDAPGTSRAPATALVAAIFALLQLVASIFTIVSVLWQ